MYDDSCEIPESPWGKGNNMPHRLQALLHGNEGLQSLKVNFVDFSHGIHILGKSPSSHISVQYLWGQRCVLENEISIVI